MLTLIDLVIGKKYKARSLTLGGFFTKDCLNRVMWHYNNDSIEVFPQDTMIFEELDEEIN